MRNRLSLTVLSIVIVVAMAGLALALVQGSGTSTRILTAPHLSQSQSTIFRAGVIDLTRAAEGNEPERRTDV